MYGADLVELFRDEFVLCALQPGENVVVLSEPDSRHEYVSAAMGAARLLGAEAMALQLPSGSAIPEPSTRTGSCPGLASLRTNDLARRALIDADFVVDVTNEGFSHSALRKEVLDAGTRILFVCDAPDALRRNFPTSADKDRVQWGIDLLSEGSRLYVTSKFGTEIVADLKNAHPGGQKGFTDKPGTWDHWPSTMNTCWPDSPTGTIVLAPGDILLPFKEYVSEPVTVSVDQGHILSVSGGLHARLIEMYMQDSGDQWAWHTSHMGWGLMRSADWLATMMYSKQSIMGMDARAFAGNFLWSTGHQPFLGRESYAHLDIAMRSTTVRVDDVVVVDNGELTRQ